MVMKSGTDNLVRLGKSQAQPAAAVLARAFQNYPAIKYYFPDNARRSKVNRYFYSICSYFGLRYGEMYTTSSNMEGIAVWMPSANYNMNFRTLLSSVPLSILFGMGAAGGFRFKDMSMFGVYVDKVHKRLAPFNHWYLMVLGVDPGYQGKGYASKLVRPMLIRADQEKLPCYLETNDEADVPIYRHFGFKVIEEGTVPGTTVKNWAMLREVNKASSRQID
jgi:ribosomal protein S18 acetylase RimI-like enzyme